MWKLLVHFLNKGWCEIVTTIHIEKEIAKVNCDFITITIEKGALFINKLKINYSDSSTNAVRNASLAEGIYIIRFKCQGFPLYPSLVVLCTVGLITMPIGLLSDRHRGRRRTAWLEAGRPTARITMWLPSRRSQCVYFVLWCALRAAAHATIQNIHI